MAILSPSILGADVLNLERDIRATEAAGVKWLHVDCMDGAFVPNMSFGYSVVSALRKATECVLDVHLMIKEPIRYVEAYAKAGSDYITVHIEADTAENVEATIDKIHALGKKAGISVKPKTPAEAIAHLIPKLDLVLVMTVEPGFGGQSFMEDMMPKLRTLREMINEMNPDCHLEVDGGVDGRTQAICRENGANVLVAGSAFYRAEDKDAFRRTVEE